MKTTVWVPLIAVVGLSMVFVQPPFSAPDELQHLGRAMAISQGQFTAQRSANRIGGWVPQTLLEVALRDPNRAATNRTLISVAHLQQRVFLDYPQNALYSPIPYLPQALSLAITTRCSDNPLVWLFGARLANFCVWLLLIRLAVFIVPLGRPLVVLIACLPQSVALAASASADAMSFGLITLFLASVLRLWSDPHAKPGVNTTLVFTAVCFPLCKVAYAPLLACALPLFFTSSHRAIRARLVGTLFMTVLAMGCWARLSNDLYLSRDQYHPIYRTYVPLTDASSPEALVQSVLRNPYNWLSSMLLTLSTESRSEIASFRCCTLPDGLRLLWALEWILILAAGDKPLDPRLRALWGSLALATAAAIMGVMFGLQDVSKVGVIGAWQSRYLIPLVFPMALCCLGTGRVLSAPLSWVHLMVQAPTWLFLLSGIDGQGATTTSELPHVRTLQGWTITASSAIELPPGLQIKPFQLVGDGPMPQDATLLDDQGGITTQPKEACALWRENSPTQQFAYRMVRLVPDDPNPGTMRLWCFNPRRIYQQLRLGHQRMELAPHTGIWLRVTEQQTLRAEGVVVVYE